MTYEILMIPGTILLYFFLYFAAGSLAVRLVPDKDYSVPRVLILGFFLLHFLFFLITMPLKVTLQPLSLLSAIWAVVLVLITIAFFISQRGRWVRTLSSIREAFDGRNKYITLAFFALALVQILLMNGNDETYAIWDQSYYLGDSVTSWYTNTISQYSPYTGRILNVLNSEYLLETYQNHTSVMCQLLNIHPMVENLTIMATVVVILYNLIALEIGKFFFKGDRFRSTLLVFFLTLLNFFSYNLYTAAEFLFIRPSEGKTILAVLILPSLFYCFLKVMEDVDAKTWWIYSFLIIAGSFGLNMSSIFMIPFELSALYIPYAIHRKKISIFVRYLILMLPCVLMAALYLLTKHEFLIYTGK